MDKELLKKLNSLKQVQPSAEWREKTREALLSQISSLEKTKEIHVLEQASKKGFFSIIHQPAWAVFCVLLILAGGIFSAQAAKNIKPGNSLYIARIVSEKAQLAITFNKEKKARLDLKFAHTHAKEITEVLADPNFDHENNKEKAAKLAMNFKQELNTVKERLEEINKIREIDDPLVALGGIIKEEEGMVHSVDSEKEGSGLDYYEPDKDKEEKVAEEEIKAEAPVIPESEIAVTSTEGEATSTKGDIFDKAEETLLAKDFEGTRDILEQVDEIIENIDNPEGEVKGIDEEGTSTPEVDTNTANSTST